jgi:diketogulonate reductase-like aldo/keto reductase
MEILVDDDLIESIGVSNFNLKELQEAGQAFENEHIAATKYYTT